MGPKVDLTGKTFHWLIVLGLEKIPGKGGCYWKCRCKCGKEVIRSTGHLNEKVKHSCGCRGRQYHHQSGTHFYNKYREAKKRCNNPNADSYKYYGGKGIKFEWRSFEEFRDDMYEGYIEHVNKFGEKNTSLDRINGDGNYCKNNCRWATREEQNLNRCNMVGVEYMGERMSIASLCKRLGIKSHKVYRLIKKGINMEDIINHFTSNS